MQIDQGLRLVHAGAVTQTNNKLASITGGAMWDPCIDMSAYAGDDVGNTSHLLVLADSVGKRMQAFIGASGGGETLGSELITNGTFTENSDWTGGPGISIGGGTLNYEYPGPGTGSEQAVITLEGAYYSVSFDMLNYSSGSTSFSLRVHGVSCQDLLSGSSGNGTKAAEATAKGNGLLMFPATGNDNFSLDNVSLKRMTDFSTNGVHLHSARSETNRNVASIDSDFDLSCTEGYTFKIYSCP